jgi:uncharacterized protein (DUF58 family)
MRIPCIPSKQLNWVVAALATAALVALLLGIELRTVIVATATAVGLLLTLAAIDFYYSRWRWRHSEFAFARQLPAAFAIGVKKTISLQLSTKVDCSWSLDIYDGVDATLKTQGMPAHLQIRGGQLVQVDYTVLPSERGTVDFNAAELRVRSRQGWWELREQLGALEQRRVYPDFAQVARYAWLAGDQRLSEMGIKTFRQRGEGTDFKQLEEYRVGDAVRHIDWKATMRLDKPIVRQFQSERDQCVMLLIDCGRRMRADEGDLAIGKSHFDQVLNATMLLTYVALKHGDAVGALTFGTPHGEERWFAPHKGAVTLNSLMNTLYDVQPTPTHSDYLSAAKNLLRHHHKRSLVIVITNFRDEDSSELGQALQLLRTRHLVMTASLRERVVRQLAEQPIANDTTAIEIASAIHYEQQRRDAFNALAAHDSLMVDAEPERLSIELVNRYHAVKRAGMI